MERSVQSLQQQAVRSRYKQSLHSGHSFGSLQCKADFKSVLLSCGRGTEEEEEGRGGGGGKRRSEEGGGGGGG